MENAENKLNQVQVGSEVLIRNKLNYVLSNNAGLQKIKTIRDILTNKNERINNYIK
jgi:hypothetical protein